MGDKCIREDAISLQLLFKTEGWRFTDQEIRELKPYIEREDANRAEFLEDRVRAARLRIAGIEERQGRLTDAYIDQVIDRKTYEGRKASLLLELPDATIHTFRALMEDGEQFRPYMERLPSTSRAFFKERFFDRSFNETKKQVLTRLWGVLSNATFDRMFSYPRSKVNLFEALQEGRIVLINTAKDLLKDEGASILGRFFIALIAQVALRRASLPAHERRPCFVYVDEAADYFDDKIGHLLNQARKYKVGMVLAHQNLDQLTPALRASVFSSTSIKFAGGVSGKDAAALSSEMHVDDDFLLAQRKRRKATSFACYVRNVTPQALSISIPLGVVERLQKMREPPNHPRCRNKRSTRRISMIGPASIAPAADICRATRRRRLSNAASAPSSCAARASRMTRRRQLDISVVIPRAVVKASSPGRSKSSQDVNVPKPTDRSTHRLGVKSASD